MLRETGQNVHMTFPLASERASRFEWMGSVGSTNTELARRVNSEPNDEWPHLAVLATDDQTAGKGRLGRDWSAPAGSSLAISVLVRPTTPSGRPLNPETLGWFGLLAGLAMTRACNKTAGVSAATLKWPNDVLIDNRKVCGVLSEVVVGNGPLALVVGAGVNLTLTEEELPVATATSLALSGAKDLSADALLADYLDEFSRLVGVFLAAEGDVRSSGILELVTQECGTLGRSVRVEQPAGSQLVGTASAIAASGAIVVTPADGTDDVEVAAGDVTHLRVIMDGA